MTVRPFATALAIALCVGVAHVTEAGGQSTQTITIRGHQQTLRVYGARGATPIVISSGDGGWIHLAPHVAEVLSAHGFFVVGFDVRAYLTGFTSGSTTLRVEDEPGDYKVIVDFAAQGSDHKPLLIGVSEGAGLSVLAAAHPRLRDAVEGVIGLGLSDQTELAWRWRDMAIYLTHGVPHEPTFSVKGVINQLAPVPLAVIHSTRDEFVPLAEVQDVLASAREPQRLWVINAANHRFSDNLAGFDRSLLDAIAWIADKRSGRTP